MERIVTTADNPVHPRIRDERDKNDSAAVTQIVDDDHGWCLIRIPSPCQEWIETVDGTFVSSLSLSEIERKATNCDLALDLVYIVLTSQLGRVLRYELEAGNGADVVLRDFLSMFLPIWFQWHTVCRFLNLFGTTDMVNTVYFALNVILMSLVGISAESCGSTTERLGCNEFAKCISAARVVTVFAQLYAIYFNRKYTKVILLKLVPDILVTILWFSNSFTSYESTSFVALWWLAMIVDVVSLLLPSIQRFFGCSLPKKETLPLNVSLVVERNEQLIVRPEQIVIPYPLDILTLSL